MSDDDGLMMMVMIAVVIVGCIASTSKMWWQPIYPEEFKRHTNSAGVVSFDGINE